MPGLGADEGDRAYGDLRMAVGQLSTIKQNPAIRIAGYQGAGTWRVPASGIDLVIAVHSDARVIRHDADHNDLPWITHYRP